MNKFISLLFLLSTFSLFAQKEDEKITISLNYYNTLTTEREEFKAENERLKNYNERLKADSLKLYQEDDTLRKEFAILKRKFTKLAADSVVLSTTLNDSIAYLNNRIAIQSRDLASLDTLRLKLVAARLEFPYDRDRIEEAVNLFNSIGNENIRKNYAFLTDMLKRYPIDIASVRSLLNSIRYDGPKLNKYQDDKWEEWKNDAVKKISENQFYKDQKQADFRNNYLYRIVMEADQRVKNSDGPENMPDFSDLLIRLNLN